MRVADLGHRQLSIGFIVERESSIPFRLESLLSMISTFLWSVSYSLRSALSVYRFSCGSTERDVHCPDFIVSNPSTGIVELTPECTTSHTFPRRNDQHKDGGQPAIHVTAAINRSKYVSGDYKSGTHRKLSGDLITVYPARRSPEQLGAEKEKPTEINVAAHTSSDTYVLSGGSILLP